MNVATVILLAIADFIPGPLTRCDCPKCSEAARLLVQGLQLNVPAPGQPAQEGVAPPLPPTAVEGTADKEPTALLEGATGVSANIRLHIREQNKSLPAATCIRYQELICRECQRRGVSPALITALISTESSFNADARSPSGALGLGQLMPEPLADLGVEDPLDPEQNIRACVSLVASHLDRWKEHPERDRLAVASYRVGYGAVVASGGVPDSPAVVQFVEGVLALAQTLSSAAQGPEADEHSALSNVIGSGR